jgi:hypothetical protein
VAPRRTTSPQPPTPTWSRTTVSSPAPAASRRCAAPGYGPLPTAAMPPVPEGALAGRRVGLAEPLWASPPRGAGAASPGLRRLGPCLPRPGRLVPPGQEASWQGVSSASPNCSGRRLRAPGAAVPPGRGAAIPPAPRPAVPPGQEATRQGVVGLAECSGGRLSAASERMGRPRPGPCFPRHASRPGRLVPLGPGGDWRGFGVGLAELAAGTGPAGGPARRARGGVRRQA